VIRLIHGKDRYLALAALREIRASLSAENDMLETNTTVLEGPAVTPGELLAHCQAVPFLGGARLVVVEGLLAHLGGTRRGRRTAKKPPANDPLAPWAALAAQLADAATMPETTTLVLLEGELTRSNAAFPIFAPIARVRDCAPLEASELATWIKRGAAERNLDLAPRALAALQQLTAGDLWTIENELDKLATYADGGIVDETTIVEVVSSARESRIWDLTDAVVAGDEPKALTSMGALLQEGQAVPLLMFMLVRQYRQIAIVKDMRECRVRQDEIARTAGLPGGRVNAVSNLSSRYSWDQLHAAYAALLDADLAVKRGLRDDEASLQLVVHQLCTLSGRSPATYRRPAAAVQRR
jgi:DNA polymerase-3 subunit delta